MDAGTIERIETNVERGAALFFAAAIAFAVFAGLRDMLPPPQLGVCAAAAAVGAYIFCVRAMSAASPRSTAFNVQVFDVRDLEPTVSDELVLTNADRLQRPTEEPLLLEDAVTPPEEDSRVVRLFDRRAMPTPGQLNSRIDDHLAGRKPAPQSDASKALAEALAELRRSLR